VDALRRDPKRLAAILTSLKSARPQQVLLALKAIR
jgi:hypothetical protein